MNFLLKQVSHFFNQKKWTLRFNHIGDGGSVEQIQYRVELQCLEHLWNHENMFQTGVI